ncbi:hypothetical protein I2I05_00365 [Hymenobacter sp. BT683]|uniref:Uncharacterized protein n=2 Tax=Hymenobacter jeongseonensis TaxID=2791027 RepID=A0ABS0IBU6_9BACT|nr:hypothetical protein [Hymenobacter jeongseonensis]
MSCRGGALMRRWGRLAGLALLLGLSQCRARTDDPDVVREHVIFENDFEQMPGWLPVPDSSLTTERAHSGRYSVRVDKKHPFSVTYRLTLRDGFSKRPRRLRLSAWAWVEGPLEEGRLIFLLNPPNAVEGMPAIFSTHLFLADKWPYKRWTYISRDINLPPEIASDAQIVVFLWHFSANHPLYADDWKLTEIR